MKRIPNHKIDNAVTHLVPFTNYNNTISADIFHTETEQTYHVWHWATKIAEFNLTTGNLDFFNTGFFSQTTSALQGRLLRNLPEYSVKVFLDTYPMESYDRKRLKKMARQ